VISNAFSANYVFTPSSNQCATPQTLSVTVIPRPTPTFSAVTPFCAGSVAPIFPSTSNNGFTGTWSPAVVDNMASGTYLFTPDAGLCATTAILNVFVNQPIDPNFPDLAVCSGTSAPTLPSTSPNGIQGTWNPAVIDNMTSGTYLFTPDLGECANPQTINVVINEATLAAVTTAVTNAFSDNQVITVIAVLPGNYLYQLDHGLFQESPIFENVGPGMHSVTVVDANGCAPSITVEDILIIGYPPYFTPNGDTFHDTWNIADLKEPSRIYIFDRYGKLLKQISPDGLGWDGTFNGELMPSSDYWFLVQYDEQGAEKEFRAHFTLKR
jgi:gliding motility-associated-like protein